MMTAELFSSSTPRRRGHRRPAPTMPATVTPLVYAVPVQLMAYCTAFAAGGHFLHVGDGLLEGAVMRRDHDHAGMVSSMSAIGPCLSSPAA
jgi:hypothetical protein